MSLRAVQTTPNNRDSIELWSLSDDNHDGTEARTVRWWCAAMMVWEGGKIISSTDSKSPTACRALVLSSVYWKIH